MRDFNIRTCKGKIVLYRRKTARGIVKTGRTKRRFYLTEFKTNSGKYPKAGDIVKVVLSGDGHRLISVWAL